MALDPLSYVPLAGYHLWDISVTMWKRTRTHSSFSLNKGRVFFDVNMGYTGDNTCIGGEVSVPFV